MKTVHEYSMDGAMFVHSWFYSWMVSFAPADDGSSQSARQVEGLFESLLAEVFS